MELFPAQPDLSLQISPPNTKPSTTSNWKRTSTEEEMDLGFWKRALDSRNSLSSSRNDNSFDLSLSNPTRSLDSNNNTSSNNLIHHHFQNSVSNNNANNPFQSFQQNHYFQHPQQLFQHHQPQHQQHQSLSQELGFLRPIRGIPVYQNPPPLSFPQLHNHNHNLNHHLNHVLDGSTTTTNTTPSSISNTNTSSSPFQSQALMRSRFLSRFPAKRSMRAPRMRWTTTLHARFVHAVELLGGHESMLHLQFPFLNKKMNFILIFGYFSIIPF
jgi:hypothetical protein